MTSRDFTRRFPPPSPSRQQLAVAAASALLGIGLGIGLAKSSLLDSSPAEHPSLQADLSTSLAAERKLSPTGRNGIIDIDPAVRYPVNQSADRAISPTGRTGFIDVDPEVLYGR